MLSKKVIPFWFLFPSLLLLLIFTLGPIIYNFWISFTNISLFSTSYNFVGADNYLTFVSDPEIRTVIQNSYTYVLITVLFQFLAGFLFALILNQAGRSKAVYTAIFFLPWVISDIVAVASWKWVLNDSYGLLNYYFGVVGLPSQNWLADPRTVMGSAIAVTVWKGTPFSMIIELAGLQGIPKELYEAGIIDGTSRWAAFRYITVPLMKNVILINLTLITMYTFNIFGLIYALTGGGPVNLTEVISLHMYRQGFEFGQLGYGSTLAVVLLLINVTAVGIYLRILLKER